MDDRSKHLRQIYSEVTTNRDFCSFYIGYTSAFMSTEQLHWAWDAWQDHQRQVAELEQGQEPVILREIYDDRD